MRYTRPQSPTVFSTQGFTLVELMVSVAIFAIVMLSVSSAYLTLISLDRQTRATTDVVDNLSFALDSMSRNIRTGTNYNCVGGSGGNCPSGSNGQFQFVDSSGQTDTYLLSNGSISECPNSLSCSAGSSIPITDPRINIDKLTFYVRGVGTSDNAEPNISFVIHGSVTADNSHTPVTFDVQTSATQRGIDL